MHLSDRPQKVFIMMVHDIDDPNVERSRDTDKEDNSTYSISAQTPRAPGWLASKYGHTPQEAPLLLAHFAPTVGVDTTTASRKYQGENDRQAGRAETDRGLEQALADGMPIVHSRAKYIQQRLPHYIDYEDLVSAGVIGLIEAYKTFDSQRHIEFRTYCRLRIQGAIIDSLRALDWASRSLRRKGRALAESITTLTARLGRRPSEIEVAFDMGLSLHEYHLLVGKLDGAQLEPTTQGYGQMSETNDMDSLPGKGDDDPLSLCIRDELKVRLAGAIKRLPEREQSVIILFYCQEQAMKQVAVALGVTQGRISQIHSCAVRHLRHALFDYTAPDGLGLNSPQRGE